MDSNLESVSLPSDVCSGADMERLQRQDDEVSDVDLPSSIDSDCEIVSLPDSVTDTQGMDTAGSKVKMTTTSRSVPSPAECQVAGRLQLNFKAMEVYSPPRVLPKVHSDSMGPCRMSLDILTGWNLLSPELKRTLLNLWHTEEIEMLFLSPPCTVFSVLQTCFRNKEKMDPARWHKKWDEGVHHVDISMTGASLQLKKKKKFMYEHPERAKSWELPQVKAVRAHPSVLAVEFDQCMLNLRAPNNKLMKKRTRIMTNCVWLARTLSSYQCDRSHEHQRIEGNMAGHSLSWWAQHYPDELCEILAASVDHD